MALFEGMEEVEKGPKYLRARWEYLHAIEAVLGTAGRFDVVLPSADDLEVAFELVEPPAELTPYQLGQLQAAMRAQLADRLRMREEYNGAL